jgi:hypothetical protein
MSPIEKVTRRPLFNVICGLVKDEIESSEQLNIARSLVRGLGLGSEEVDTLFELFEEKRREFKDVGDISNFFEPPAGLSFSRLMLVLIEKVESIDQLFVLGWVLSDAELPEDGINNVDAIAEAFEKKTGEFENMSYLLADVPNELRRLKTNLQ